MLRILRLEGTETHEAAVTANTDASSERKSSLDVGELSPDLLHKHRQVVDLVLVDAHCGDAWHVGELDMRRVVVAVQDQSAELLQAAQQSRVPIRTE